MKRLRKPRPEHGHDADDEDDEGERDHHVDDSHHDRVDLAAEVAGDRPDDDPHDEGDCGRHDADEQIEVGGVDDPRGDISAEVVRPERVLPARRLQGRAERFRRVWHDEWSDDRDEGDDEQEQRRR